MTMSEHTPLTEAERLSEAWEDGYLACQDGKHQQNDNPFLAARTSTATADTGLRERVERAHAALADTTLTDGLRISRAMIALGERGPQLLDALDRDRAAGRLDATPAPTENRADNINKEEA